MLNICIECVIASEKNEYQQHHELHHQEQELDNSSGDGGDDATRYSEGTDGMPPKCCSSSVASTEVAGNVTEGRPDEGRSGLSTLREPLPRGSTDADGHDELDPSVEDSCSDSVGSSSREDFFDTHQDCNSLPDSPASRSVDTDATSDQNEEFSRGLRAYHAEIATSVTHRQSRRGARCPVQGVGLLASGDQLYAPYLQRPEPLTEYALMRRRTMLGTLRSGNRVESLSTRILIPQRLQHSKLLSDMRSFKAANPGAIFQDFVNWYGNPDNPLEECKDEFGATLSETTTASEAMQVLIATRTFWSDTWDEASPCPASEQSPLFDASTVAERTLHALETMPPAHLLNQVLAANLAAAGFILRTSAESSEVSSRVPAVQAAMDRLSTALVRALDRLGKDVAQGFAAESFLGPGGGADTGANERGSKDENNGVRFGSYTYADTVVACEAACDAIGDAEIVLSRAGALLHKFPGQYEVVQSLLVGEEGQIVYLDNPGGRRGILAAVRRQQDFLCRDEKVLSEETERAADDMPLPSVREYVLYNGNEDNVCQLSAWFGGAQDRLGEKDISDNEGGLLLAFSKCEREY